MLERQDPTNKPMCKMGNRTEPAAKAWADSDPEVASCWKLACPTPINIPNLLRYLPQMEHLGQAIVIAGAISALVFHHEQRPVLSLATKSG